MKETKKILNARYELLREIGRGGFSNVFYAYDKKLKKYWAIKKIQKVRDHPLSKDLLKEVEILKDLHHPMLPNIVDIIEKKEAWYVVMDYILGTTLEEYQKTNQGIETDILLSWGKELADVMDYLHQCNPPIIHQDLKPSNIMIKPRGSLMLLDFGIAMRLGMEKPVSLGTKGYAAPEQYGNRGRYLVDERTDIYGLGKTLEIFLKVHQNKRSKKDKELKKIMDRCTKEDPKERYQNCMELRDHFDYA
ncbi:MAG TPA: serine/threonine protein kinase, partial [Candidatus Merdenecus merdavium]|nr:serine/threonine protein kinase [Candidatus Merdenecus merdavium]